MPNVILGLGANLGDRETSLRSAIAALEKSGLLQNVVISPIYESDAQLPPDAPESWNKGYYNMAIRGATKLCPPELLRAIRSVERELGRTTGKEVWGPREIDIDILAYDSRAYLDQNLTIPHPHLAIRPFALLPLIDVCPGWAFPLKSPLEGRLASDIAKSYPSPLPFNTRKVKEFAVS